MADRGYSIANPQGIYFVTFAVVDWVDVFTRSEYSEIVVDSLKFCQKEKGLIIHAWCLMTNHIHLIISSNGKMSLSEILRDFKKYTSSAIIKAIRDNIIESRKEWMLRIFEEAGRANKKNTYYQFWQHDNHPKELVTPAFTKQKLDYLHHNPVTSGLVNDQEAWTYSSAIDYAGGKGLIDVEFID